MVQFLQVCRCSLDTKIKRTDNLCGDNDIVLTEIADERALDPKL